MGALKQRIIDGIIDVEGGYVDDPSDSGGETNFGVTVSVARANGYHGPMRDMLRKVAYDIYTAKYWDKVCGDQLTALCEPVAKEVVDTAVNMGPGRAGKFLQRSLNVLNNRARLYPDLVVDGDIGPSTLSALAEYLEKRSDGVSVLVRALNCLQGAFYIKLAERREKDERFVYGWFKHRVVI